MKKILREFYQKGIFVSIYSKTGSPENFSYGKIISVDNRHYAMYMISPDGKFDGVKVDEIDNVLKMENSTLYDERMSLVMSISKKDFDTYKFDGESILKTLLLIAKVNKQIVSVELLNSGIYDAIGFVHEIKNNLCIIEQVDHYGMNDGKMYFDLNDITKIVCHSNDEQTLLNLYLSRDKIIKKDK